MIHFDLSSRFYLFSFWLSNNASARVLWSFFCTERSSCLCVTLRVHSHSHTSATGLTHPLLFIWPSRSATVQRGDYK